MKKLQWDRISTSAVAFKRALFIIAAGMLLEGCVAGQSIELPYRAEAVGSEQGVGVVVEVEDHRPFILDGDKEPDYIGHYRAGFGNPWDVTTESGDSLADIMRQDLIEELEALGFGTGAASPDRSLTVAIKDWNFNAYVNGSFWYKLDVAVADATGEQLALSVVEDEVSIEGSVWTGAKGAMEEEIPRLYGLMLKAIIRENDEIMGALAGT